MDCAASEFYNEEKSKYDLQFKSKEHKYISTEQLLGIYDEIFTKYPVVSVEDGFEQDDW